MSNTSRAFFGLLLILVWLLFLHGVSIHGFSQGYLRTKAHLDGHSECFDVSSLYSLPDKSYLHGLGQNSSCWNRPRFDHVVILLIDSLRFDFCVMDPDYNDTHQEEGHAYIDPGDKAKIIRYYKNKLPIINETLSNYPQNSRLFRFVADPPTATMQRIKALTTGGMPTFLEISDNFASEAIHEDNWVIQMSKIGRKAIFMGDDTWLSMYPTSFYKSFPYPSFEVRDLHTVDQGVQKHLIPEIRNQNQLNNNKNGQKKKQSVQEQSSAPIDEKKDMNHDKQDKRENQENQENHDNQDNHDNHENSKSFDLILGHMLGVDHVGHRLGSNHPEMSSKLTEMNGVISRVIDSIEGNTLFVVMSDHGMNYEGNHGGSTLHETSASLYLYSPKNIFKNAVYPEIPKGEFASISQIDIVPTISMLLGAPIPFGSLGMIIPELFWDEDKPQELLDPLHVNSAQLLKYLSELEKNDNRFPKEELATLKSLFAEAVAEHTNWQTQYMKNLSLSLEDPLQRQIIIEKAKEIVKKYRAFHDKAVDMCRRLWTTFDTDSMEYAIYAIVGASIVPALLALSKTKMIHRTLFYVAVGMFWAPLTWLVGWKSINLPLSVTWLLVVAVVASLGSFVIAYIMEYDILLPKISFDSLKKFKPNLSSVVAGLVFVALFIFRSVSLHTNSFIINARQTNTFITTTLIVLFAFISYRNGHVKVACSLLLSAVLTRSTSITFAGRHENYFVGSTFNDLMVYTIIPTIVILALMIVLISVCLRNDIKYHTLFISPILLLSIFWFVQYLGMIDDYVSVRLYIPWIIFGSSIFQILYLVVSPWLRTSPNEQNTVDIKSSHPTQSTQLSMQQNFLKFSLALIPTTLIILGPASPLPILFFIVTCLSLSWSVSAIFVGQHLSTPLLALYVMLWSYIGYTYFYATSHLPVFTALQMSAAFIGIEGFSLELGGTLVIYNTMFSHFLLAITVPILGINLLHLDRYAPHKAVLIHNFLYCSVLAATFISSLSLRRHLFVWTVFAPYFVFECITILVVDLGLLIGTAIAFGASRN